MKKAGFDDSVLERFDPITYYTVANQLFSIHPHHSENQLIYWKKNGVLLKTMLTKTPKATALSHFLKNFRHIRKMQAWTNWSRRRELITNLETALTLLPTSDCTPTTFHYTIPHTAPIDRALTFQYKRDDHLEMKTQSPHQCQDPQDIDGSAVDKTARHRKTTSWEPSRAANETTQIAFTQSDAVPHQYNTSMQPVQHLKLPKLELPDFSGDVNALLEFWDLFSAAVHNNPAYHLH